MKEYTIRRLKAEWLVADENGLKVYTGSELLKLLTEDKVFTIKVEDLK